LDIKRRANKPVTSLGHQAGRKLFGGDQIFKSMSNSFKLCPTHFFRGAKNFVEGEAPMCPPGYGPACQYHSK